MMSTRIFIGNLNFAIDDAALRGILSRLSSVTDDKIASAEVIHDGETGHSRGFAIVELAGAGDARQMIGDLDGVQVMGRTLRVQLARPLQGRRTSQSPRTCNDARTKWCE
jgi:RNA recognition motif-containing protein